MFSSNSSHTLLQKKKNKKINIYVLTLKSALNTLPPPHTNPPHEKPHPKPFFITMLRNNIVYPLF